MMSDHYHHIFQKVQQWASDRGILVINKILADNVAGEFNGSTITMNQTYGPHERLFYLTHALGSIVGWSLNSTEVKSMFDALRTAKADDLHPELLEKSLARYRAFETASSSYGVWLLEHLGATIQEIDAYTNFMLADLEALTVFHRTGEAPIWRQFLARWFEDVAKGRVTVLPFQKTPIPQFDQPKIESQRILQRHI